jgi:RNA polymerase sigma factor (sigma-70 family)
MTRAGRLAAPQGDEERLYRDYHQRLSSSVAWAVQADPALIEDACARAWEQLIRHQPQRTERMFAWLRTVAIREAWALARREQREAGRGDDDSRELAESQPAPLDVDGALETRRAPEALAALRDRERRYLALKTAGYSYKEIADRCGVTYTNVNKHLTRARARLRAPAAPGAQNGEPPAPAPRGGEPDGDRQLSH